MQALHCLFHLLSHFLHQISCCGVWILMVFWIDNRTYCTPWYSTWLHFTVLCYIHARMHRLVFSHISTNAAWWQLPTAGIPFLNSRTLFILIYQLLTATAHIEWPPAVLRWQLRSRSKSQLFYEWWSCGQSMWLSSTLPELKPRLSLLSGTCVFVDVEVPFLLRGWVHFLQLLLFLTSAIILWSESHRTNGHVLLSQSGRPSSPCWNDCIYVVTNPG
jgi:hypothetical protein